jgi:hypothetical protein
LKVTIFIVTRLIIMARTKKIITSAIEVEIENVMDFVDITRSMIEYSKTEPEYESYMFYLFFPDNRVSVPIPKLKIGPVVPISMNNLLLRPGDFSNRLKDQSKNAINDLK